MRKVSVVPVNPGQQFGFITIIKELEPRIYRRAKIRMVEGVCKCGKIQNIILTTLTAGAKMTCGSAECSKKWVEAKPAPQTNKYKGLEKIRQMEIDLIEGKICPSRLSIEITAMHLATRKFLNR